MKFVTNPFCYDSSEDVVHHSLEGSRAISHSKEHHEGFKEAAIGVKGHFLFIFELDTYIIETLADIQFCEVPGSTELRDEFGDKCHDLAKRLSHYLYFFFFLFLFFYLGLTTQKKVQESVMSQVSHKHSHMTGSHRVTLHDVT